MSDTTFSSIAAELVSGQLRLRDDRIAELEAEIAQLRARVQSLECEVHQAKNWASKWKRQAEAALTEGETSG